MHNVQEYGLLFAPGHISFQRIKKLVPFYPESPWVGCAHDIFLLILDGIVAMPATLLQLPHVLDTTRLNEEGGGSL